jgi:hypothetical protein
VQNNLVSEVSREWGKSARGAVVEDLWRSLWAALTSVIPDSRQLSSISVRAYTSNTPFGSWQQIELQVAPNHAITIHHSDLDMSLLPDGAVPEVGRMFSVYVDESVF